MRDDRGKDLAFSRTVVACEDVAKQQVNQLGDTLPDSLAPGKQVVIEVQYVGHPLGYAETGMRYIRDRIDTAFTILRDDSSAYPRPGFPLKKVNRSVAMPDFSDSARIIVPKGLMVANGGRLDGIDTVEQAVTFRYSSLKPSRCMSFAIAKDTEVSAGSVRVSHLSGDGPGVAGVAQAAEAVDRLTRWLGARSDPTPLTLIEIPDGWGSQADVTTIIQCAAAIKDPRWHGEVYHEISHLWPVESADRPSSRRKEGLASFLEDLVREDVTGRPVVDARANALLKWLRDQIPTHEAWRTVPLADRGQAGLTDLSYSVGAMHFAQRYRLDGRETFNTIIGTFAANFGTRGGGTKGLADLVRETASIDLSQLNTDWLHTTAWADRVAQLGNIDELEAYYRRRRTLGS